MPCFYLNPEQDDFNKIPELQICIAEALYDAKARPIKPQCVQGRRNQDPARSDRVQPRAGMGDHGQERGSVDGRDGADKPCGGGAIQRRAMTMSVAAGAVGIDNGRPCQKCR